MKALEVDVSVVVGSNEDLVFSCLRTMTRFAPKEGVVLNVNVVVNSGDQSLRDRLSREFPTIAVIVNSSPLGFASNHNNALKNGVAPLVLMLNDDLFFLENTLLPMLEFMAMHENSDVGAVSPRLLNQDMTLQPSTYSFPGFIRAFAVCSGIRRIIPRFVENIIVKLRFRRRGSSRHWAHDSQCDVETFRGACVLYRREALDRVSWLDECALVGGEETELHIRLVSAGWRNVFLPLAEIVHIGRQSVGGNPFLEIEYIKGFLNILRKHNSRPAFEVLRLVVWLRFRLIALVGLLRRDDKSRALGSFGSREMSVYTYHSHMWRTRAQARWLKE